MCSSLSVIFPKALAGVNAVAEGERAADSMPRHSLCLLAKFFAVISQLEDLGCQSSEMDSSTHAD